MNPLRVGGGIVHGIAALSAIAGGMVLVWPGLAKQAGPSVGSFAVAAVMALLGSLAAGGSRTALFLAMAAYAIDTALSIFLGGIAATIAHCALLGMLFQTYRASDGLGGRLALSIPGLVFSLACLGGMFGARWLEASRATAALGIDPRHPLGTSTALQQVAAARGLDRDVDEREAVRLVDDGACRDDHPCREAIVIEVDASGAVSRIEVDFARSPAIEALAAELWLALGLGKPRFRRIVKGKQGFEEWAIEQAAAQSEALDASWTVDGGKTVVAFARRD